MKKSIKCLAVEEMMIVLLLKCRIRLLKQGKVEIWHLLVGNENAPGFFGLRHSSHLRWNLDYEMKCVSAPYDQDQEEIME